MVVAAALLHDVVEDTALTTDVLLAAGLPRRVVPVVLLLTHADDEASDAYCARMAVDADADVWLVKFADLDDNSDLVRLAELDAATVARLRSKYAVAYAAPGKEVAAHLLD